MTPCEGASGSPGQPIVLIGEALVVGNAEAAATTLAQPLSFWGGYDSERGAVIDPHHPQYGASLAGLILVMPHAKGSSSSSSVLAEAIRNGTGPHGIILRERDLIICIGAIVARELYGISVPVVVLDERDYQIACRGHGRMRIQTIGETNSARVTLLT